MGRHGLTPMITSRVLGNAALTAARTESGLPRPRLFSIHTHPTRV